MNKEQFINDNYLLAKKYDQKMKRKYFKLFKLFCLCAVILNMLIIVFFYAFSNNSSVFKINVLNNSYLTSDDVIESLALKNSKYDLVNSLFLNYKVKSNPFIEDVQVVKHDGNVLDIILKEKRLYGYFMEDSNSYFLAENENIMISPENMYIINDLPLIEGLNQEQRNLLVSGFNNADPKIIKNISEIHYSPVSYDENALMLVMKDGNYVYGNERCFSMLEQYGEILSAIQADLNKNYCIILDEITNSGYTTACEWE